MASDATDDERRWAEAGSILRRSPTPSARARVRGHRRVLWLSLVGVSLLGALVGAMLAGGSGGHVDTSEPGTWQVVIGLVCMGLVCMGLVCMGLVCMGLVCMGFAIVTIVWLSVTQFRSGLRGGIWRAPTAALTRRQRKELYAQVRGKRPADPTRLPLSRDLAWRLVLQERSIALYVGLLLRPRDTPGATVPGDNTITPGRRPGHLETSIRTLAPEALGLCGRSSGRRPVRPAGSGPPSRPEDALMADAALPGATSRGFRPSVEGGPWQRSARRMPAGMVCGFAPEVV